MAEDTSVVVDEVLPIFVDFIVSCSRSCFQEEPFFPNLVCVAEQDFNGQEKGVRLNVPRGNMSRECER